MALSVFNLGPIPNAGTATVSAGTNCPAGNSALGSSNFAGIVAATPSLFPSSTQYIAGYVDGTQHARLFTPESSAVSGSVAALPVLTQITQIFQTDSAGNSKAGGWKIYITPGVGSPDTSSPAEVFLDDDAVVILAGSSSG